MHKKGKGCGEKLEIEKMESWMVVLDELWMRQCGVIINKIIR